MSDYVEQLKEFQNIKGKGRMKKNIRRKNNFIIRDLLTALVICHNVTPSFTDNIKSYQASSPDEIAFVKFCESINLKLLHRDQKTMKIELPTKEIENYEILAVFPFKSSTKRMGIVVKH
jgi:phospholipid-translocating ATPase